METAELIKATASLLGPALTFLLGAAEALRDKAAEKLGEHTWEAAKKVWERLRGKEAQGGQLEEVAAELVADPEDALAGPALQREIRKLILANPELADELRQLVASAVPPTQLAVLGSGAAAAQGGLAAGEAANLIVAPVGGDVLGAGASKTEYNVQVHLVAGEIWRGKSSNGLPKDQLEAATAQYLEVLLGLYEYLDLRGMGVDLQSLKLRFPLLDTYVPLSARPRMPEGETWERHVRVAGRRASQEELETMRPGSPEVLVEVLAKQDGLVVLGDPGSGKSTFLKYLAVLLASGRGSEVGLGGKLPFLLPLSFYAEQLEQGDVPLDDCLCRHYDKRGMDLPLRELLEQALADGRALILLDGLDEVRQTAQRQVAVNRVVDFFVRHRRAGNKFVLTSRIVGYAQVRPSVAGLAEATLIDFEDEQIASFVTQWTAVIERAATDHGELAQYNAEAERSRLLAAIEGNPGVRSLAASPLLLTILALMHRQSVVLPDRRAQLYETFLRVLITHWHQARSLSGRPVSSMADTDATLRLLAPLALWMQQEAPGRGLVQEHALEAKLKAILKKDRRLWAPEAPTAREAAKSFLAEVRAVTGVLLARGSNAFGFLHLTFQEYLAAAGLVAANQEDRQALFAELQRRVGDPDWREVLLLAIEHLSLNLKRPEAASYLVERLLREAESPPGVAACLAGQAVAEMGSVNVTAASAEAAVRELLAVLEGKRGAPAPVRAEAGRSLAKLGDPRREVTHLDAMRFCWVPAGPFVMGDDRYEGEKPQHTADFLDYDYWMARFPVTGEQWRQYVELARPEGIHDYSLGVGANEPVVMVSWHEALAFCAWLTERWRDRLPPGWSVQLPSEAEWEKAVRGGLELPVAPQVLGVEEIRLAALASERQANPFPAREFPWGDQENPERANYDESGIGRPSAVGAFAAGRSVYGCEELSGNVSEWTRSLGGTPDKLVSYPYVAGDGREDTTVGHEVFRVLRGGSYFGEAWWVRCSARLRGNPLFRYDDFGFRVLVCPLSADLCPL